MVWHSWPRSHWYGLQPLPHIAAHAPTQVSHLPPVPISQVHCHPEGFLQSPYDLTQCAPGRVVRCKQRFFIWSEMRHRSKGFALLHLPCSGGAVHHSVGPVPCPRLRGVLHLLRRRQGLWELGGDAGQSAHWPLLLRYGPVLGLRLECCHLMLPLSADWRCAHIPSDAFQSPGYPILEHRDAHQGTKRSQLHPHGPALLLPGDRQHSPAPLRSRGSVQLPPALQCHAGRQRHQGVPRLSPGTQAGLWPHAGAYECSLPLSRTQS